MNVELPTPFTDVMITYEKVIGSGPYGDTKRKEVITKRGFYSDLFNKFSISPSYQYFYIGDEQYLLPNGFGGDHLPVNKIIKWEYALTI